MGLGNGEPGSVLLGATDRADAVAAIKAALRISSSEEDGLIGTLADTALGMAEQFLGQVLIMRSVTSILPVAVGWQRLPGMPVRAINTVNGIARDGATVALPLIDFAIDIDSRGDGWVRIAEAGGATRLAVTAQVGQATSWATLPAPLRQGVVLLASYLFSERDTTRPPPAAITALWRPFRGLGLARAVHA